MQMRISIALLALAAALTIFASGCNDRTQASSEPAPEVAATAVEKPAAEPAEKPAEKPEENAPDSPAEKPGKERTTESGLKYTDKKFGKGDEVKVGDVVTVHYKGWLSDGTVFDTSRRGSGDPLVFRVGMGEVIRGWDEGLVGMKVGGIRELTIPPDLAYGSRQVGPIPANSTLHFEVEVMDTKR